MVGLVFVGLELRQNTRIQRVNATQMLAAEYADALDVLADDPHAACVYVKGIDGLDNLDGAERLQFFVIWFRIFRAAEQLHYYAEEGMVEPRIWRSFQRQLNEVSRLPGVREWWTVRRDWFSDDFQAFIDELVESTPPAAWQTYQDHACAVSPS